jgi:hypothetical protein
MISLPGLPRIRSGTLRSRAAFVRLRVLWRHSFAVFSRGTSASKLRISRPCVSPRAVIRMLAFCAPPAINPDGSQTTLAACPTCATGFGNAGVGIVRGPHQLNFDFAVLKETNITEDPVSRRVLQHLQPRPVRASAGSGEPVALPQQRRLVRRHHRYFGEPAVDSVRATISILTAMAE